MFVSFLECFVDAIEKYTTRKLPPLHCVGTIKHRRHDDSRFRILDDGHGEDDEEFPSIFHVIRETQEMKRKGTTRKTRFGPQRCDCSEETCCLPRWAKDESEERNLRKDNEESAEEARVDHRK